MSLCFLCACTPSAQKEATHQRQTAQKKKNWIRYPSIQSLSPAAQLGKHIFFDATLSASGKMSCATCHDPAFAYAPANDLAVQLGGQYLDQPGTRAVPSLRYLRYTPFFTRHYYLPNAEGAEYEGPAGGFNQDGAFNQLRQQVMVPLLAAHEMANLDAYHLTEKIKQRPYAKYFQALYGKTIFEYPDNTLKQIGHALEAFLLEDPSFEPYTSKFDAVMSENASFTESELRGYRLFKDPAKGNCAECHQDTPGPGGRPAQFTDFTFQALGVPRNPTIAANRVATYYDMGICGPARQDMQKETQYCGMFKTPTLRNVATRQVFFHNGYFTHLEDVILFYMERDTHPHKWYPKRHHHIARYNDLPRAYHANIDHVHAPFYQPTSLHPTLSESDIADLIAFLKTLTDGYTQTAGGE